MTGAVGYSRETVKSRVTILGNFDGVHLGHRKLIETGASIARQKGLVCCAWTFREHPQNMLTYGSLTQIITPNEIKKDLLKKAGADEVLFEDFSGVRDLSKQEFVKDILINKLNTKVVICGFNYRFGKGAKADIKDLDELCRINGIELVIIPPVTVDGIVVSSSQIRSLIIAGELDKAAKLLGHRYSIREIVVSGKQLGRTLGLPTINQILPPNICRPVKGVYATRTFAEGKWLPSVTNIGIRPTVSGKGENVETHIIGYEGDLYGKYIETEFIRKIRNEIKFPSVNELKDQIKRDIEYVDKIVKVQGED